MSELAAHLVEHVLPRVPIRQWVFTVPVPIRYQLAFDASLTRAVLGVLLRTLFGWQRRQAARRGLVGARSGSGTAIQRFGGSVNLNVHFHVLLLRRSLHAREADGTAGVSSPAAARRGGHRGAPHARAAARPAAVGPPWAVAGLEGFSLHADVAVPARRRAG